MAPSSPSYVFHGPLNGLGMESARLAVERQHYLDIVLEVKCFSYQVCVVCAVRSHSVSLRGFDFAFKFKNYRCPLVHRSMDSALGGNVRSGGEEPDELRDTGGETGDDERSSVRRSLLLMVRVECCVLAFFNLAGFSHRQTSWSSGIEGRKTISLVFYSLPTVDISSFEDAPRDVHPLQAFSIRASYCSIAKY